MSASLGLVEDAALSALPRARASDGTNGQLKHRQKVLCWTTANLHQCLWMVSCLFTRGATTVEFFAMCTKSVSYRCYVVVFCQRCAVIRQSMCDDYDARVSFAVSSQSVGRVRANGSNCRKRLSFGERVNQTSAAWAFEGECGLDRALLDAECVMPALRGFHSKNR